MKDETQQWIDYAEQDKQSARILLQSHLYNPCLYHVQQSIAKCLLVNPGLSAGLSHPVGASFEEVIPSSVILMCGA